VASKENRFATVDMTGRTKDNSVGGNDAGNEGFLIVEVFKYIYEDKDCQGAYLKFRRRTPKNPTPKSGVLMHSDE
jgi:hypothetical protein